MDYEAPHVTIAPFFPAARHSAMVAEQPDWLVPGLVATTGVTLLASAPKVGKTSFATALARAVVRGEPFLGSPVRQAPVVWCAYEESPRDRIALHEGLTEQDPLYIAYADTVAPIDYRRVRPGIRTRRLEDMEAPEVFDIANALRARLIVIDPLHGAFPGANLGNNGVARAAMQTLRMWSVQYNVAVLVLHHLGKSRKRVAVADSNQISATASCALTMTRRELPDGSRRIILQGRGRYPAPVHRMEIESRGLLDYRIAEPEPEPEQEAPHRALTAQQKVQAALAEHGPMSAQELAQVTRLYLPTVRVMLHNLRGQLKSYNVPRDNRHYELLVEPTANLDQT